MAVGFFVWALIITLKPPPEAVAYFNEVCVKTSNNNNNESFISLEANFNIENSGATDKEVFEAICRKIQSNQAFSGSQNS